MYVLGLPRWLSDKESACSARDLGLIPGLGRSPGEGNGNPPQYSCLGNPMHRGTWWATVHEVTKFGHDLATKPPPPYIHRVEMTLHKGTINKYLWNKGIYRTISHQVQ